MHARGRPSLRWWSISILLVGAGLLDSAYLVSRVFTLLVPSERAAFDLCSALFFASCDGALADQRFWILNVPLAGWGLVYFSTVGGLLLLARFVEGAFESYALLAASALALAGVGVGVALSVSALLGHAPICPLCLSIHVLSLALLFTLQRAIGRPVSEQVQQVRDALAGLIRSRVEAPEKTRWTFVGFGSVALVAVVIYQWAYVETALRRPESARPPDRAKIIAAYRASPSVTLPVTDHDPHLGPLTAPVQLVVFGSFQCPHCQRFAASLSRLRQEFRDRLLVVYKHYPLSTRCNGRLVVDMQPGACEIAWAAEAARRQAQFWPFHDAMMATATDPTEKVITETVRRLRLDPIRFEADRRSDSTMERVAEDVALGNRLKVPGTPTVFLDGRMVRSAKVEVLEILVRDELGHQAARSTPRERAVNELGRPSRTCRPVWGG